MAYLKILRTAAGIPHQLDGLYVIGYDADYHLPGGMYDGGDVKTTTEPEQANVWESIKVAHSIWRTSPTCECHRFDKPGHFNRPLTAFTVEIGDDPLEGGKIILDGGTQA